VPSDSIGDPSSWRNFTVTPERRIQIRYAIDRYCVSAYFFTVNDRKALTVKNVEGVRARFLPSDLPSNWKASPRWMSMDLDRRSLYETGT
jgi:hypothetical protein